MVQLEVAFHHVFNQQQVVAQGKGVTATSLITLLLA